MKDATRTEAIAWCKENKADFIDAVFPPPNGWMWGEQIQDDVRLTLTAIFTNTVDEDINYYDVYGPSVAVKDWSDLSEEAKETAKGMIQYCIHNNIGMGMDYGMNIVDAENEESDTPKPFRVELELFSSDEAGSN